MLSKTSATDVNLCRKVRGSVRSDGKVFNSSMHMGALNLVVNLQRRMSTCARKVHGSVGHISRCLDLAFIQPPCKIDVIQLCELNVEVWVWSCMGQFETGSLRRIRGQPGCWMPAGHRAGCRAQSASPAWQTGQTRPAQTPPICGPCHTEDMHQRTYNPGLMQDS